MAVEARVDLPLCMCILLRPHIYNSFADECLTVQNASCNLLLPEEVQEEDHPGSQSSLGFVFGLMKASQFSRLSPSTPLNQALDCYLCDRLGIEREKAALDPTDMSPQRVVNKIQRHIGQSL